MPKFDLPETEYPPYYVFNADNSEGFVIISGDDRVKQILGFSDTGEFSFDNLSPQLSFILSAFADHISSLPEGTAADSSWTFNQSATRNANGVLLETANWGQGYPYNLQTPLRNGVNCPTGCLATATAIVMKYHNWPEISRGHRVNSNFKEIDYSGVTFDWDKMSDIHHEEGQMEVSKLMRHIGKVMNISYSPAQSSGFDYLLGRYLYEFFSYSVNSQTIYRSNFSDSEWYDLLINELNSNRPVIYGGVSMTEGGHEFVCDGYNDIGFHINWGWDGENNGYYDLQSLLGFTDGQRMVINISPTDYDTNLYSDIFIDKGYQYGFDQLFDPCGLNISTENIESGQLFNMTVGQVEIDEKLYSARIRLALVDENNHIKAMAKNVLPPNGVALGLDEYWSWDISSGENFAYGNNSFTSDIMAPSIFFDCDNITPNDRVQLISRRLADPDKEQDFWYEHEYMEDDWKFIAGTLETPSFRPAKGNKPSVSYVNFIYPDGFPAESVNSDTCILRNSSYHFWIEYPRGLCTVNINGQPCNTYPNSTGCEIEIIPILDNYDVDISYIPYAKTESLTLNVSQPGTLEHLLSDIDISKVTSLKVEGKIDVSDLLAISDRFLSIDKLDLSGSDIMASGSYPENTIPTIIDPVNGIYVSPINSISIRELILPESLEYIQLEGISCRNLYTLMLPSSLKHIEGEGFGPFYQSNGIHSLRLRTVVCKNKIPFKLDNYGIHIITYGRDDMDCFPTTLIIPKGTKDAYALSEGWDNFTNIVEMDDPSTFDKVIDGVRYIGIGETAELYNCYFWDTPEHLVIPDHVSHNGKDFKVTRIAPDALYGSQVIKTDKHLKFLTLNKSLAEINNASVFSTLTDTYFALNETPIEDWRPYLYNIPHISVYNPYLFKNLIIPDYDDYTKERMTFYVPGGFPEADWNFAEMWSYKIDKTNGIVKIKPLIREIKIDNVCINGKEIQPVNGLYYYTVIDNSAPEVIVNYTIHNRQAMTTQYDISFNASLPDTDLSNDSEILVASLNIDPTAWNGNPNSNFQITATILPENATEPTLEWKSDNEKIAIVDSKGFVTVLNEGKCTITAQTIDGSNILAECVITSTSGVDELFTDQDEPITIITMQGSVVNHKADMEDLKNLSSGTYILKQGDTVRKIIIR